MSKFCCNIRSHLRYYFNHHFPIELHSVAPEILDFQSSKPIRRG
uniref:Uncharacterized protein n=1 Tax=Rhizophora mucronata TaxID=61149 RepID=A0A2P2PXU5_RHIMU